MKNAIEGVSAQTLKRIPTYLTYLEEQKALGKEYISTPIIANAMGLSEILVKKDLTSILTTSGKPKVGHNIQNVIDEIKYFLGVHNETKAILVGAGQLGSALLGYKGFDKWNIKIEAAFDKNEKSSSKKTGNIAIMNVNKLRDYLLNNDILSHYNNENLLIVVFKIISNLLPYLSEISDVTGIMNAKQVTDFVLSGCSIKISKSLPLLILAFFKSNNL